MVQSLSLNRGTALPFYKTIEFATPARYATHFYLGHTLSDT